MDGNIQHERSKIVIIILEYYTALYSYPGYQRKHEYSLGRPEFTISEITLAISQLKTGQAPGKDGITTEM